VPKKNTGTPKSHIKQKAFQDRNYSPLESLPLSKGRIESPFRKLGNVNLTSWRNDFLPNSLWACILSSLFGRDQYLSYFRQIIGCARDIHQNNRPRVLAHNHLASLKDEDFNHIFQPILTNDAARGFLRALRLVDCLPDAHHWARCLDTPDMEKDWNVLIHAVADNFDHQSERATDVRWLKIMHEIVSGDTVFDVSFEDRIEDFRQYPSRGKMTSVRPSIRSMEMSVRHFESGGDGRSEIQPATMMGENFWIEMKSKTVCILPTGFEPPSKAPNEMRDEVMAVMEQVQDHFDYSLQTTNTDPRHDGAFGLVLFAMSYLLNLCVFHGHDLPPARTVLRSIVEVFITLEYLGIKDNQTIWEQYRRFGAGQAKLAFLKNIREENVPDFFDLKVVENLANEDMWMELEDITIGNWAATDLRSMSQFCGVKDTYDRHYNWTSGFAHGHWIAVRETAFVNCINPLHRYHRIPGPPLTILPSMIPDAAKLVNRMLDRLNALYPPFKPRLTKHSIKPLTKTASAATAAP
jgi:Family of unknown function (DUF5677)